ncbi:MAG: DUF885 family protein [Acidobacteria bacterium]|nr:DUF885 family protein [Acidobacteriota bacterium]
MEPEVRVRCLSLISVTLVALVVATAPTTAQGGLSDAGSTYGDLVALFEDWRQFEHPGLRDGAPDYTAEAMARQGRELRAYRARLTAIDPSGWPIEQQVDHHLVRAEMNGLDFNLRVMRPWARDPAFYQSVWTAQSDTPAHEGPTHHALVELWTYAFPLAPEAQDRLTNELNTIPPLLTQARGNLVGNARELWLSGIGNIRGQAATLEDLAQSTLDAGDTLKGAIEAALEATLALVDWLEAQAPSKRAPSGIGKENYTWYLRHVHLVPLSWQEEVGLLKRELDRAHASLALEEHRNRNLPPLEAISSPQEYDRRANEAVTKYLTFLEEADILPVRDYMDPALRAHIGRFAPVESRNFFQTAIHYEPMTLWTHFYHWFDLALMELEPHASPMRRGPLLYNIFDSRSEGLATGVEEMMMHAGLYDDNPRAREIVWIMLAQRAARGLGSLYVHANELTMKEARDFHVAWTPRGWMREDLDLLGFEQQLYLRQPGYGTSYISGKYLIERLLTERARQLGDDFTLSGFYADLDALGVIPVSLIRWQLTGKDDEIRALVDDESG